MVFMSVFGLYNRVLHKHPWTTKCLTNGIFTGAGDVVAQMLAEKKKFTEIDWKRVSVYAFYGTFISGPLYTAWFSGLDRFGARMLVQNYSPKLREKSAILTAKICLDQFIFSTTYIPFFMMTTSLLQDGANGVLVDENGTFHEERLDKAWNKVKATYVPTLEKDFAAWPMLSMINFSFVPARYQVLYVGVANTAWNAFLCTMSNGHGH
jgi:protein Mpv17